MLLYFVKPSVTLFVRAYYRNGLVADDSARTADLDEDGDVDGEDLATFVIHPDWSTMDDFASAFGKQN